MKTRDKLVNAQKPQQETRILLRTGNIIKYLLIARLSQLSTLTHSYLFESTCQNNETNNECACKRT